MKLDCDFARNSKVYRIAVVFFWCTQNYAIDRTHGMDKFDYTIDYFATMDMPTFSLYWEGEMPTFFLKYRLK